MLAPLLVHARDERKGTGMVQRSALFAVVGLAIAPWVQQNQNKRLVLDVSFETSKDYDITSAYAVRGWNTTGQRPTSNHERRSRPSTP